jgi:hypothetical protein
MTKIELEVHDDALTAINKIKGLNDSGIELIIPEGSILFDNIISLKLIQQLAEKSQKIIQFTTDDETGLSLISLLGKPVGQGYSQNTGSEFRSEPQLSNIPERGRFAFDKPSLPKIKLPKFNGMLALLVVTVLLMAGVLFFISKKPVAYVKIVVNSQPFTRSPTIKVKASSDIDSEKMELKGQSLEVSIEVTDETPATGEKLVGEKAEGEVTLYNKTITEIKIEKGTKLNYDKKDLVFLTNDDVTIPPKEEQPNPDDPKTQIFKLGEAEVKITASDIGDQYNINADEDLGVDDYKSSELTAKTKEKTSGGESKLVKVISEEDKVTIQKKVSTAAIDKASADLKFKLGKTQRLVEGSVTTQITKEAYSAKPGDEAEKLNLTVYANATGLTYMDADLNSFLDKKVQDMVPRGYVLSEKKREVIVTPLGNSSSSVLNSTEADLQITLKTFIVTEINKDEIKKNLGGKTQAEAEKILGSVTNISTYGIEIKPTIPLFNKVPKDPNRIILEVENE